MVINFIFIISESLTVISHLKFYILSTFSKIIVKYTSRLTHFCVLSEEIMHSYEMKYLQIFFRHLIQRVSGRFFNLFSRLMHAMKIIKKKRQAKNVSIFLFKLFSYFSSLSFSSP